MFGNLFKKSIAVVEVSAQAYDDVAAKLAAAGAHHAFCEGVIVMTDVALARGPAAQPEPEPELDPIARHRARVLAGPRTKPVVKSDHPCG